MAATSSSSSSPTSAHADTELIDKNPTSFTAYELDADAKKSAHGGLGGAPNAVDDESDAVRMATKSTRDDAYNMFRMGKKQQFVVWHFNPPPTKLEDDADPSAQRQFRLISTVAFVSLATAAWELGILLISPGLEDGGIPGLLYSLVWSFLGALPVYLSLAEMASMAPISGAQYHWVSEFAPDKYQKLLSYLTGWTSTIAWQAGNCLGVFLTGTLIQTIIQVANPDYSYPNWQGTLLVIAAITVTYIGNVYGSRALPHWQTTVFAVHVAGFFGLCVPIWVLTPKISAKAAFTDFRNYGGWSNMVLAVFAGQLSAISAQVGLDTAAHMSEDVKDAGRSVPIVMLTVYCVNFVMILGSIATVCFGLTDIDAALDDITGYPVIWVLRQTMSKGWIIVILVVANALLMAGNISYMAAVTRDLFAFARDQGLPFSTWISQVHPRRLIPVNGARLTSVVAILLSLIYIGSPVAVYAITSLLTVALLQCYFTSIACVLWRRIYYPETLPPAKFSLGKWGVTVNTAAVLCCLWGFFWCFWPQVTHPSAADMNWAGPIYGAVLLIALVYYIVRARHIYEGPVAMVMGRGRHADIRI